MKTQPVVWARLAALGCLLLSACTESAPVESNRSVSKPDDPMAVAKGQDCNVDGSKIHCSDSSPWGFNISNPPKYANLLPSYDASITNELVDTDGGVAVTASWLSRFDLWWDSDAGIFKDGGSRATAPGCGGSFSLIEPDYDSGYIVGVLLRGNSDGGANWNSDIVALDTPQRRPFVDGEGYVLPWSLEIRKNIDVYYTKGRTKTKVCTVYVHDVEFSYVPVP